MSNETLEIKRDNDIITVHRCVWGSCDEITVVINQDNKLYGALIDLTPQEAINLGTFLVDLGKKMKEEQE